MVEERIQRRLAAIMSVDLVGYSRLMDENETGTLSTLKNIRAEIIDPAITEHHGHIVKLIGDGALIEFASVVDAVECAVSIQQSLATRNTSAEEDKQFSFRIGVNLGDVIIEGDDIYGDGVNVAARLEGLAEPGGICISGAVFDQVNRKLNLSYDDLGPQQIKNISDPVRAYHVHKAAAESPTKRLPASKLSASTRRLPILAALAFVAILVGGGIYAWMQSNIQPAPIAAQSPPVDVVQLDKPSIAVLAFQNMSGDADQEYFADGIAEDIITDLSKISSIFVIARNSSFQYKGQAVDISKVGRELGVKYVVEGSVRRAGNQMRITAQLIETETGGHLWAERYDGEAKDVFALQDKVTSQIVKALKLNLTPEEKQAVELHGTENPEAYDAYLKGLELIRERRWNDWDASEAAEAHFKNAVRLDPDFAQAMAGYASANWLRTQGNYTLPINLAYDLAKQSIALGDNALARRILSYQHFSISSWQNPATKKLNLAITELERARQLQPGNPDVLADLATALSFVGRPREALKLAQLAIKLNPKHPKWYFAATGIALLFTNESERATGHLQAWSDANPTAPIPYFFLVSALGNANQKTMADKKLKQLSKYAGHKFMTPSIKSLWPMQPEQEKIFLDGLRLAGMKDAYSKE